MNHEISHQPAKRITPARVCAMSVLVMALSGCAVAPDNRPPPQPSLPTTWLDPSCGHDTRPVDVKSADGVVCLGSDHEVAYKLTGGLERQGTLFQINSKTGIANTSVGGIQTPDGSTTFGGPETNIAGVEVRRQSDGSLIVTATDGRGTFTIPSGAEPSTSEQRSAPARAPSSPSRTATTRNKELTFLERVIIAVGTGAATTSAPAVAQFIASRLIALTGFGTQSETRYDGPNGETVKRKTKHETSPAGMIKGRLDGDGFTLKGVGGIEPAKKALAQHDGVFSTTYVRLAGPLLAFFGSVAGYSLADLINAVFHFFH